MHMRNYTNNHEREGRLQPYFQLKKKKNLFQIHYLLLPSRSLDTSKTYIKRN